MNSEKKSVFGMKTFNLKALALVVLGLMILSTPAIILGNNHSQVSAKATQSNSTFSIGEIGVPPISAVNPFNPASDFTTIGILYDYMFSLNWPPLPYITGVMAAGWSQNANGTSYVLSLRPNLKWDNGSPLNATDLAFTLNLYNESQLFPQTLTNVTILNSTSVNFTLSSPDPQFILEGLIGNGFAVLPYQTFGSVAFSNLTSFQNLNNIVADGPYVFYNYTGQNPIVYTANPYYWNGPPHFQTMDFYFYSSQSSYSNAYVAGQVDAISPGFAYQQVQPIGNLSGHSVIGPPYATPALTVEALLNDWVYPTSLTAFRRALAYATNSTLINQEVNGPYANQSVANQDYLLNTYNQQIGFSNGTGPTGYSYNVTKAKQILQAAGFKYSGNTLEYSNGTAVTLTLLYRNYEPYTASVATILTSEWGQLGIGATPQEVVSSTLRSMANNATGWQVIIAGVLGPQTDNGVTPGPGILNDIGDYWVYGPNQTHDDWNSTFYSVIQKLQLDTPNSSQFNADAQNASEIYVQGVPTIPLFNTYNWLAVSNSFYWGNPQNYTGIYYTQAITGLAYWDLALDTVAPASSSSSSTTSSSSSPTSTTTSMSASVSTNQSMSSSTSMPSSNSSSTSTPIVTTSSSGPATALSSTSSSATSSSSSSNNSTLYAVAAVVVIIIVIAAIVAVMRRGRPAASAPGSSGASQAGS